jgi:methyl-accepting chemotaxis protein
MRTLQDDRRHRQSSPAGKGYLEYWWPRPGSDKPSPKLGFVKRFKP